MVVVRLKGGRRHAGTECASPASDAKYRSLLAKLRILHARQSSVKIDLAALLFTTGVALFLGCGAKLERVTVPATVDVKACDMIGDPQRYLGVRVRIRARFSSDCYHGSSLSDFHCRYQGISAYADSKMSAIKQDTLLSYVCPPPPTSHAEVSAKFTGMVRPANQLLWPYQKFGFAITDVEDMKVLNSSLVAQ